MEGYFDMITIMILFKGEEILGFFFGRRIWFRSGGKIFLRKILWVNIGCWMWLECFIISLCGIYDDF